MYIYIYIHIHITFHIYIYIIFVYIYIYICISDRPITGDHFRPGHHWYISCRDVSCCCQSHCSAQVTRAAPPPRCAGLEDHRPRRRSTWRQVHPRRRQGSEMKNPRVLPRKNGGFTKKNGGFTMKNGRFTVKPMKNDGFTLKNRGLIMVLPGTGV